MATYLEKEKLTSTQLLALDAMLGELENNRLEITLAPSADIENALRGKKIRTVMTMNAEWYRKFCADYPSSRKRDKRTFDTAIRRHKTVDALKRMLKTKHADTVYGYRILAYIPGFIKAQQAQFEAEKAAYKSIPKREAAPAAEDDDWSPF